MFVLERYIKYNRNPKKERTGDCAIRAISMAYDMDYDEIVQDFGLGNNGIPAVSVISLILSLGASAIMISDVGEDKMSVSEFCSNNSNGTFLLAVGKDYMSMADHLVCCKNGDWYDTWDSGNEKIFIGFKV